MNRDEALKKLQATELEILLILRDFCAEHDVLWFLDGGTLLGAVRHGGFIPWDDDVDVGMLRKDYDRFVALAKQDLPDGFSYHDASNTPGYAAMFGKIYKDGTQFLTDETLEAGCSQGIFVDIFPYDRLAASPEQRRRQLHNARTWQSMAYLYHAKTIVVPHRGALGSFEKAGCRIAHHLVRAASSPEVIEARYGRSILSDDKTCSEVLTLAWPNMTPFPIDAILPMATVQFEGHDFPAPGQTTAYLEATYGDWRALPAPEDRRTHLPKFLDFGDGTRWEADS